MTIKKNDYSFDLDAISHHGILGMKWGVRRYQNEDGTLTEAGKARVSKEYKKLRDKGFSEYNANYSNRLARAKSKSAYQLHDEYEIKKKNGQKQEGTKFENEVTKRFSELVDMNMRIEDQKDYNSNKNLKKANDLIRKYDMTSWDEVAKQNASFFSSAFGEKYD